MVVCFANWISGMRKSAVAHFLLFHRGFTAWTGIFLVNSD